LDSRQTTLHCKKKYCCDIQKNLQTGGRIQTSLAESPKEGYDSERAVLPVVMTMNCTKCSRWVKLSQRSVTRRTSPTVFSQLATLENQTCGTSPCSVVRAILTSDIQPKEVTCSQIVFIRMPQSYHASSDCVYVKFLNSQGIIERVSSQGSDIDR
jgi:hypothetical protein